MLAASKGFLKFNNVFVRTFHQQMALQSPNVAVVLAGCGVYDGSEVHEASACLVHLSRQNANVKMFAPDKNQMHAIDHTEGKPMKVNRNVLVESARIARGKVESLSELKCADFDAIVFPGGFGAAKNLSTWAIKGPDCEVDCDVSRVIQSFHTAKKPIGLCCIAPVLAAKCIPGVEVTVGSACGDGGKWPYAEVAGALEKCGAKHVEKDVTISFFWVVWLSISYV